MIIRRWLGDTDFDGKSAVMRIVWDELKAKNFPIVKVDGKTIRNVILADDELGIVQYVKARKIQTISMVGKVEII